MRSARIMLRNRWADVVRHRSGFVKDADDHGRCRVRKIEIRCRNAGHRQQHDQPEFDVDAVAACEVAVTGNRGRPVLLVGASEGALLNGFDHFMFVSATKTDDDTALEASEDALEQDGEEDE